MRVFITGINGFVGKLLKKSLVESSDEVYGLDLNTYNDKEFSADITDCAAVDSCIRSVKPDCIVHLAAISKADSNDYRSIFSINVSGTLNILTSSLQLNPNPNILLISSSQVYGIVDKTNQPISEDSRVQPVNYYGASKAAAENIAYAFYSEHGLPVCIIRPFNHIGRGQDRHFLISKLIDAARKGIKDIELGQTDVVRDFTDVRDVIDAYCRIIKNFQAGDFFNICRGIGYRLDDVIYSIEKLSNIKFNISRNNEFIRKNDIPFMIGDNAKISRFFDWSPKYSLEDTLKWILSE